MYIADSDNHRVRKVTVSTGIITTIAGTGTSSYSGDNGQATSATLNNPAAVALDSSGTYLPLLTPSQYLLVLPFLDNLYIADGTNNRVRKVTMSTATTYSPRY